MSRRSELTPAAWWLSPRELENRVVKRYEHTVKAAGRSLLNYVSRWPTAKSGVTMRVLRQVRIAWAWREGLLPDDVLDGFELLVGFCLLEQGGSSARGL